MRSTVTRAVAAAAVGAILVLAGDNKFISARADDRLANSDASAAAVEFFENRVRPVLVAHCIQCHGPEARENGLRLDARQTILDGGDSGPAIVPGDADGSLMIQAIQHAGEESLEMPPDVKLPADAIEALTRWVATGASWPDVAGEVAAQDEEMDWTAARQFWSFQRPTRHDPPPVVDIAWPRKPIDYFVLARIEQAGLSPNPPADRRTLIRRVSFDLTGLPPTVDEVRQFVDDPSPDAYQQLIDRLLASPRYGQHWARMWLDVARYAEDQAHIVGNNKSLCYPNAYLYRDWVIDALNDDLRYDEFIRLQLAADLINPDDAADLPALGFLGLGPKYYNRGNLEVQADEWADRVDTVTRSLLGLTVACARCHDHKYDPIEAEDYYALAGVFASTEMLNRPLNADTAAGDKGQAKKPEEAMHVVRDAKPRDLHVFVRGDVKHHGELVPRRFVRVLCNDEPVAFADGSGRLELARAIAAADNPLTARVIVNRVWRQYFGRGLVGTPSNFGALGQRPTHPELLDDLAARFVESGWSLKWLHREIAMSATYRQSSVVAPEKLAADQPNTLLARMNRKRLSVEAWRDTLLAVTGVLDERLGGQSFQADSVDEHRRTVYSHVSRLDLNSMLALFDFPDPNAHAARRAETTTALQKLFVMNSPFMARRAEELAEQLVGECEGQPTRAALDNAYLRLLSRPATDEEAELGLAFLSHTEGEPADRWRQYAGVLLAANELMFID